MSETKTLVHEILEDSLRTASKVQSAVGLLLVEEVLLTLRRRERE